MTDCIYWGENRLDEMFIDVGCVLGCATCPSDGTCSSYTAPKVKKS